MITKRKKRLPKIKRKCIVCDNYFVVSQSVIRLGYGKCCSHKCGAIYRTRKIKCICKICNKIFYIQPNEFKKGRKYCSNKCRFIGQNNKITKICKICNKKFKKIPSYIKRNTNNCCSRQCSSITKSGKNNPSWKGGKVKRLCQVCGKEVFVKPSAIKIGQGKFCSYKCMGKWNSKNKSGKNHSCWKGGITPINLQIRCSDNYNIWHKQIFERDNHTCQKCGLKSGNGKAVYLHAHHIKKFSVIINDIKRKYPLLSLIDIVKQYPDMWDIKNGITLCKKCHNLRHRRNK